MICDFDKVIDRKHCESTKWDRYRIQYQDETLLPLWLADMDFGVSKEIQDALIRRAEHPTYGYTDRGKQYYEIFADRYNEKYLYEIQPEEVVLSTGVMYSIAAAIHLFTNPKDGVLILRPCYHPFINTTKQCEREIMFVDMKENSTGYEIDFKEFEKAAKKTKAFLFCNPHNPTGRIFNKEELEKIAKICEKNEVLIIADEIHCDFTYRDQMFLPIMNISEYTKQHTISCVAPTKAFNLAGLKISAAFIKNKEMLMRFKNYASLIGISSINIFAMEAVKAAYLLSQYWQDELLKYLEINKSIVRKFVESHKEVITSYEPEGTYFYWLHFKQNENIHEEMIFKAHVMLNKGSEFSEYCNGYERLNFACPRTILLEALNRIEGLLKERSIV